MRYVFAVLAAIMVVFAAAQYNDPDGVAWATIYAVPAIWAAAAAAWPQRLATTPARLLLGITLLADVVLVVALWPTAEAWWRIDVWWDNEAAREGMGAMLATAVVLAVLASSFGPAGGAARQRDTLGKS